jgi:hypothetical protein
MISPLRDGLVDEQSSRARALVSYTRGMRSDVDLLEAWRSGERAAGEALFERYYRVLERFSIKRWRK